MTDKIKILVAPSPSGPAQLTLGHLSPIAAVPCCLALGSVGHQPGLGGYKQSGTEHGSLAALALCFAILSTLSERFIPGDGDF